MRHVRTILSLVGALGLLMPLPSLAQTFRYVSKTGSHTSPYNTWARAATNIHAAASAAGANNIILVSNGVYALTGTVTLANGIIVRSVNGPDATTIEGNNTFRLFTLSGGARMESVTLRYGRAGGAGELSYGGAIYANNARISNCVIRECVATGRGGGVYFVSGGGLITHSTLTLNDSPYGGGVYCRNVGVISNCVFTGNRAIGPAGTGGGGANLFTGGTVTHSEFRENTAGNDGGGVLMETAGGSVLNSVFADNVAGDWGGAVAVYFSGGLVRNCVMTGNRADEGGGVYFHQSGTLENSTVVGNSSLLDGSGAKFSGGGTSINSIVYFNVGDNIFLDGAGQSIRNTCTTPAPTGAPDQGGNITGDPSFLYPPEYVLHLRPDSPCINAGTNAAWMTTATDIYGSPRTLGASVDIGAYEFGPLVCHFIGDTLSGPPTLSVNFTNFITGTNLAVLTHRWDAQDDGSFEASTATGRTFQFAYTNGGLFSVRLDVTNGAGEIARLVRTNYVFANLPHYVATNGGHVSPFITWATAATNLEAAISVSEAGGVVIVSNGTFLVRDQVIVTQALFISSLNGTTGTTIRGSGTSRVFRIRPGVVLDGFTIRDGVATGTAENANGGGIYFDGGGRATNCLLVANRAVGSGGGAYFAFGGELLQSTVISNRAQLGGGVALNQGGVVFNTILRTNVALDRGGGAYAFGNTIIRNAIIDRNAAVSNGGGVALISSGSTLQNCTVVSNSAANGGGVLCEDGGNVQNSIVYFNTASGSFANWQTNAVGFNYGANFQSSCLTPTSGLPSASGCVSNDPSFQLFLGSPYGLSGLSPCINRGTFSGWMSGASDIVGTARIVGGAPDIGAIERLLLALAITSPKSGNRFPFRQTFVTITGTADGPVGHISYTNRYAAGVITGQIPVSSNWSFTLPMPRYGPQEISVTATDAVGSIALDATTVLRNKNQIFVPLER